MIDYKVSPKKKPRDLKAAEKFYAVPIMRELIGTEKVCKGMCMNTTISIGEMTNAFYNMEEYIPDMLLNGNSVKMGNLGTLRLSFGSDGAVTEKDFKASMIKDVKIVFTASPALRDKIRSEVRFNRISGTATTNTGGGENPNPNPDENPDIL